MKVTCEIYKLIESIQDKSQREQFIKLYPPDKFSWGIEMQTYSRWTNKQQAKIFRDLSEWGKHILDIQNEPGDYVYKNVLQSQRCPFNDMFHEKVSVMIGLNKDGSKKYKEDINYKGLSKFSLKDANALIDAMLPYLEKLACTIYQEVITFNWSCIENKEKKVKGIKVDFCTFTGEPYYGQSLSESESIINQVMDKLENYQPGES